MKLLNQFPAQLRLFLVGIFFYLLFDKLNKINIYPFMLVSLGLIVFLIELNYFKFTLYPLLLGVLVMFIVYFVKNIKINFDFSYSFYILHFPIIQLVLYFKMNPIELILSFVSLFLATLVLSYLSEIYIEKRFIQIGRNITKKEKSK